MEQLAVKLSDYLLRQGVIDSEEQEVYVYSFQALLFGGGYWLTMLAIALMMHKLPESMAFFAAFFLLRSSIGGYHAQSQLRCAILSVVSFGLFLLVVQYLPIAWMKAVSVGLMLLASGIIMALAPIDHANRVFRNGERQYYRRRSIILLVTVWAAVIIIHNLGWSKGTLCVSLGASQTALALLAAYLKKRREAR